METETPRTYGEWMEKGQEEYEAARTEMDIFVYEELARRVDFLDEIHNMYPEVRFRALFKLWEENFNPLWSEGKRRMLDDIDPILGCPAYGRFDEHGHTPKDFL